MIPDDQNSQNRVQSNTISSNKNPQLTTNKISCLQQKAGGSGMANATLC